MGEIARVEFHGGSGGRSYSEEKRQRAIDALNAIDLGEADREMPARKDADRPDYNGPFVPDPTIM